MANEINSSIGVFIDGGYYAKINEGFAGTREVNLRALLDFILRKISQDNGIDRKLCLETSSSIMGSRDSNLNLIERLLWNGDLWPLLTI